VGPRAYCTGYCLALWGSPELGLQVCVSDTPSGGVVLDHVITRTCMLYWMSFRFVIVACLVIVSSCWSK
jgi:hypothetical protein